MLFTSSSETFTVELIKLKKKKQPVLKKEVNNEIEKFLLPHWHQAFSLPRQGRVAVPHFLSDEKGIYIHLEGPFWGCKTPKNNGMDQTVQEDDKWNKISSSNFKKVKNVLPWPGSSAGEGAAPTRQGAGSMSGRGTYRKKPTNA